MSRFLMLLALVGLFAVGCAPAEPTDGDAATDDYEANYNPEEDMGEGDGSDTKKGSDTKESDN